jgi:hypothetical protein
MHGFSGSSRSGDALKIMLHFLLSRAISRQAGGKMRLKFGLALVLLAGGVLPAMAQPDCPAPIAPAAPDGRASTQAQMVAAAGDARGFITQSDVYQTCLVDYVKAQKDLAAKNKTVFDKSIGDEVMKKITENQNEKVKVGNDINGAIAAFKASHPN